MLSLFSGAGGLDLGFIQAGFSPVGAFDNWDKAVEVYRRNLSIDAHVLDLSSNAVDSRESPDVVIAGSPCQGFSVIGNRRVNDARNSLFVRAAQLSTSLKPQAIVLENVRGVFAGKHKKHYTAAVRQLENVGYFVQHLELSALDAGLPQHRRRVFLVASRSRSYIRVEAKDTRRDIAQTISGSESQANHEPRILSSDTQAYEIAKVIRPGQKLSDVRGSSACVHSWDIPHVFGGTTKKQRLILTAVMRLRRRIRRREFGDSDPVLISHIYDHLGADVGKDICRLISKGYLVEYESYIDLARRFNGKYRRLNGEGISTAVDTKFGDPHYFLHPAEQRGLSVREAARIQGFPDSFLFFGALSDQFRMIGNAVPIPLGRMVAEAVKRALR